MFLFSGHPFLYLLHAGGAAPTGGSSVCCALKAHVGERLEILKREQHNREELIIFRVPRNLQEVGGKAYIPQMVSIGPYHHPKDMQKHKVQFLFRFHNRCIVDLDCSIQAMIDVEAEAKNCYAELASDMSSSEFVEMLLLDACFILELFLSYKYDKGESRSSKFDPVFSPTVMPCIRRDLLMLDNQIPLLVLERLWAVASHTCNHLVHGGVTLTELIFFFFEPTIPRQRGTQELARYKNNSKSTKHLHLLHMIQQSLYPGDPRAATKSSRPYHDGLVEPCLRTYSVSELRDYGIRFKLKDSAWVMDISFNGKGCLEIPQLVINDSTRYIALNLMAFEQCCYWQCGSVVTSFMNFMDGLINDARDVSHLHHKKIILHRLGSDKAVAHLFNHLCKEMNFDTDDLGYLSSVSNDVNIYISKKRRRWMASLRHEYLQHPWKIISLFAGLLVIGFTMLGSLYAGLSFHLKNHY